MAISVADNFLYQGTKPLDGRVKYATVALMKAASESTLYDGIIAYVDATDKYYKFLSSNTIDTDLGKWREYQSGGGSGVPSGGTTGQLLAKHSNTDGDVEWVSPASVPSAYTSTPAMDGVGSAGSSTAYAKGDHVHPSDSTKVDKVQGKGLSTEDYTTAEQIKLSGIATGAQVNTIESISVNNTTVSPDANKNVDLAVLSSDALKTTRFQVATTGWSSDTTSQSGVTLYKKSVSLSHVYKTSPTVTIGSTGVLPSTAQQTAYNLLKYVTVDSAVPCLYLYANATPSNSFYINVEGVD
jgi:hypothetical protein